MTQWVMTDQPQPSGTSDRAKAFVARLTLPELAKAIDAGDEVFRRSVIDRLPALLADELSLITEAIADTAQTVRDLTRRIEALEALQTQSRGATPSDADEEHTGGSTQRTEET